MTMYFDTPMILPGCTCGPYWSVVPPPPCPYHTQLPQVHVPWSPQELAALHRRLADILDPPKVVTTTTVTSP